MCKKENGRDIGRASRLISLRRSSQKEGISRGQFRTTTPQAFKKGNEPMNHEQEKALGLLVTDLDFRAKAASIISRLNRMKAKPENMARGDAEKQKLRREINQRRRQIDIEAGIVTADAAQEAKNVGIEIEELTK